VGRPRMPTAPVPDYLTRFIPGSESKQLSCYGAFPGGRGTVMPELEVGDPNVLGDQEWVRMEAVLRYTGKTRRTIEILIKRRCLRSKGSGRNRLVSRQSVLAWYPPDELKTAR
jgi:hypothetical protein